jgi:MSHA biogenesis protein MshN
MSLINKALKDLEERQGSPAGAHVAAPVYVRAVTRPRAHRLATSTAAAFMGGAVLTGGWLLLDRRHEPPAPVPAVAVVPRAPAAPPRVAKVERAEPATVASEPTPAAVVPTQPALPAAMALSGAAVATVSMKSVIAAAPRTTPATKAGATVGPAAPVVPVVPAVPAVQSTAVSSPLAPAAAAPVVAAPVASGTAAPVALAALSKTVAPAQHSENLHKQAVVLLQQGNAIDARPMLHKALEANPANSGARLLLANVLIEGNDLAGAGALLREGVRLTPERGPLWMSLARLEVEQSDSAAAMATLERGLDAAGGDAQYHAFYAALLQRAGRHDEAVRHYLVALRSDPAAPTWLVGIGISLQSVGKDGDALQAFQRAKAGGRLSPGLASYVDQRLESFRR